MDYSKFDYILVLDSTLNEDITDVRTFNRKIPSYDINPQGQYIGTRDLKLMSSWAFGKQLQRDLNNIGSGFTCQVFDCGGEVAVTITHCMPDTGRTASKSFIIVFNSKTGDGIVKSSSTRWRSISGVGQAVSYIRSVASNLTSYTNSNS